MARVTLQVAVCLAAVASGASVSSFDAYIAEHGRTYKQGSVEYKERLAIFERRKAEVEAQNAQPDRRWTATLNKFTDLTEDELAQMRGYKPSRMPHKLSPSSSLLALDGQAAEERDLPSNVSWKHLHVAKNIRDQGACGSCWAVATANVLDAHHEIYMKSPLHFSVQELVSCVQNPQHCGGMGGCDGATVELGMQWVVKNGLKKESEVQYLAKDGACTRSQLTESQEDASHKHGSAQTARGGASIGLNSWETLPSNRENPLVKALNEKGPVAISVAAGRWYSYRTGLFDGCKKDCVVDHAVTLYGYGVEHGGTKPEKYWLVRNSWGKDWGEKGYVRLLRHNNEEDHCGIDNDPKKGVGCDGGPAEVTVCGTCGMLFDSVVPTFGTPASVKTLEQPTTHKAKKHALQVEAQGHTKMPEQADADGLGDEKVDMGSSEDKEATSDTESHVPSALNDGSDDRIAKSAKRRRKDSKHKKAVHSVDNLRNVVRHHKKSAALKKKASMTIGSDAVPRIVRREQQ